MLSSTVVPMPANDKDFEEKCVVLFCGLLGDPNVKTVGSRGLGQHGLDLLGARARDPNQLVGVQCKLRTKGDRLTEAEVRKEVGRALAAQPPLTEYYIVTTASDDTAMDQLAMTMRQEQFQLGRRIDIQIWGWEFLQQKIRADLRASQAFDPGQSPATDRLLAVTSETLEVTTSGHAETQSLVRETRVLLESLAARPADAGHGDALEQHLDNQVDQYRDLINAGRPQTALDLLVELETRLPASASSAIRARIRGNLGWARLRLGEDEAGGRLLLEAHDLNPDHPRHLANRVLGLALTGDPAGGFALARDLLARDSKNEAVAGFAFHIATVAPEIGDPLEIVPPDLLNTLTVRMYRIGYHRQRGDTESWRRIAFEAHADHPSDDNAKRIAAEALIDEALEAGAFERNPVLPPAKADMLRRGLAMLADVWAITRTFENRRESYFLSLGVNLANAYRAIGDLTAAKRVSDEILQIAPQNSDALETALYVALDSHDLASARRAVEVLPEGPLRTLQSLNVLHLQEDWTGLLSAASDARRETLPLKDRAVFDTLVCRARAAAPGADVAALARGLVAEHPDRVAVFAIAGDLLRRDHPDEAEVILAAALDHLDGDTPYGDRVMLANLARLLDAYDAVIQCLDGYVALDQSTPALGMLALAFANAGPRPRTHAFFEGLSDEILAVPEYARLAGAAEAARGDLVAAERHLRTALAGEPRDLRSHLQLVSVLRRQERTTEAEIHIVGIDETAQRGDPMDLMRLAHNLRRAGEAGRALALGYKVARANRDAAEVMAAYPGLIFAPQPIPEDVLRAGPAGEDQWFRLEAEGEADLEGVIEAGGSISQGQYPPDHPLARAIAGKSTDDTVVLTRDLGPDQTFRLAELKPKYVWLLHDIMARHATQFPDSKALLSLRVADGDVAPVLGTVKQLSASERDIAQAYTEAPVPLAALAAAAGRSVIVLADYIAQVEGQVRACVGDEGERHRAFGFMRAARAKGAIVDTLTLWTADRLGLLPALKTYFGRLVVPRSAVDELMELREERRSHADQEYLTMSFEGDRAVTRLHTPEETARTIGLFDRLVGWVTAECEVMPTDGADDLRLDEPGGAMRRFSVSDTLDPIHLARRQDLFLLSDDLHLRQLAAQFGAGQGGWLQLAAAELADAGLIAPAIYHTAVGYLAAVRHGHVWLDVATLVGLRRLEDPRRDALFAAAIDYIGGPGAEVPSHANVVIGFMFEAVMGRVEAGGSGPAMSALLGRLIHGRDDWSDVLHHLEVVLARAIARGNPAARKAYAYLQGWIIGHFLRAARKN